MVTTGPAADCPVESSSSSSSFSDPKKNSKSVLDRLKAPDELISSELSRNKRLAGKFPKLCEAIVCSLEDYPDMKIFMANDFGDHQLGDQVALMQYMKSVPGQRKNCFMWPVTKSNVVMSNNPVTDALMFWNGSIGRLKEELIGIKKNKSPLQKARANKINGLKKKLNLTLSSIRKRREPGEHDWARDNKKNISLLSFYFDIDICSHLKPASVIQMSRKNQSHAHLTGEKSAPTRLRQNVPPSAAYPVTTEVTHPNKRQRTDMHSVVSNNTGLPESFPNRYTKIGTETKSDAGADPEPEKQVVNNADVNVTDANVVDINGADVEDAIVNKIVGSNGASELVDEDVDLTVDEAADEAVGEAVGEAVCEAVGEAVGEAAGDTVGKAVGATVSDHLCEDTEARMQIVAEEKETVPESADRQPKRQKHNLMTPAINPTHMEWLPCEFGVESKQPQLIDVMNLETSNQSGLFCHSDDFPELECINQEATDKDIDANFNEMMEAVPYGDVDEGYVAGQDQLMDLHHEINRNALPQHDINPFSPPPGPINPIEPLFGLNVELV